MLSYLIDFPNLINLSILTFMEHGILGGGFGEKRKRCACG